VIQRLAADTMAVLRSPDLLRRLAEQGS